MMKNSRWTLPLLLAVLLLTVQAGAGDVRDLPGYIDLSWIDIPEDADEIQDIDLGTVLLGLATDAEEAGDNELAKSLAMIKSIRVKAFSTDGSNPERINGMIKKIQNQLKKEDWERLVYVKDKEETLTVSTKYKDGDMVGLMVVAFEDGDDVAFVNVAGNLDLAALLRLGLGFDELDLDELLDNLDEAESH